MNDTETAKKLQTKLAETGKISAADVASALGGSAAADTPPARVVPTGPVSVDAVNPADKDPVMKQAENTITSQTVSASAAAGKPQSASAKQIIVSAEDRNAFLTVLITGKRFRRPFSLFGGGMTGTFRSRSLDESRAIMSRMKYEVDAGLVDTQLDYSERLRCMMLAAQVESMNGTDYVVLSAPLRRTVDDKGKMLEPAWLGQAQHWADKEAGLATALWAELDQFESIYWSMVEHARDQNFWNPAAST